MRCLSPSLHNSQWMSAMKNQSNTAIAKPARPSVSWETAEGLGPGRLEVNVIFTDPQATAAALKTAGSLARDLGACIGVRAAIAVPYALPLDKPPVAVRFTERLLSDLVRRMELRNFDSSVHVYHLRCKPAKRIAGGLQRRIEGLPQRDLHQAGRAAGRIQRPQHRGALYRSLQLGQRLQWPNPGLQQPARHPLPEGIHLRNPLRCGQIVLRETLSVQGLLLALRGSDPTRRLPGRRWRHLLLGASGAEGHLSFALYFFATSVNAAKENHDWCS